MRQSLQAIEYLFTSTWSFMPTANGRRLGRATRNPAFNAANAGFHYIQPSLWLLSINAEVRLLICITHTRL